MGAIAVNPIYDAAREAWKPADRRTIWEWSEDNIFVDRSSNLPGKWKSENSPQSRQIMEDFQDNRVESIAIQCSAQSSKTQTIMNCIAWAISEDPGTMLLVMATKDEVREFQEERLVPMIMACEKTRKLLADGRYAIRKGEIRFKTCTLYLVGANAMSRLQSKPIRWLILDEVRNYPPRALPTVLKRTRSFWNSRTVIISTPSEKDSTLDLWFQGGNQNKFHFHCLNPECSERQAYDFWQIKYDAKGTLLPDGNYDIDKLSETIEYECPHCHHRWQDTHANRRAMNKSGHYVAMNPKAPRHRRSYTFNALVPMWVSWANTIEEYLKARQSLKSGDTEPMRMFYTETLGVPWDPDYGVLEDHEYLDLAKAPYKLNDPWPQEVVRIMSVDKQEKGGEHYWWIVRAFGKNGRSRLIGYGRAENYKELEQTREDYEVKPSDALIDAGYKANEVYRFCMAKGWKALKGHSGDGWTKVVVQKGKKTRVRRLWQMTRADPGVGIKKKRQVRGGRCPLLLWANDGVKDLLNDFILQICGHWTVPERVGSDYLRMMTAETKKLLTDKNGHTSSSWVRTRPDNHFWDCECQALAEMTRRKAIVITE